MSLFSMKNVSSGYGKADVIRNLSIEIERGEVVTLIGANGAGKTTTLLTISALIKKRSGTINFNGEDITDLEAHQIVSRGIIHVPEGRRIFPRLTVEENLKMGAFSRKQISREIYDKVFDLFPILHERLSQAGGTLSGGEQQMLAIGRALMSEPKLLLLDEPSLGIAPKLVERIFESLQAIHESGTPILLVEQNARFALNFADRAYVIESGEIILSGPANEIAENERVLRAYLGV